MTVGEMLNLKNQIGSDIVMQNVTVDKAAYAINRTLDFLEDVCKPYSIQATSRSMITFLTLVNMARQQNNEQAQEELAAKYPKEAQALKENEDFVDEHINDEIEVEIFQFDGTLLPTKMQCYPMILRFLKPLIKNWETLEEIKPNIKIVPSI